MSIFATYDTASGSSNGGGAGNADGFAVFDDWLGSFEGSLGWSRVQVGAGASVFTRLGEEEHPGICLFRTGTDTNGRAGIIQFDECILLGGGTYTVEWLVSIEDLSTAVDEYALRFGLGDTTGGADFGNGVYFEYDRTVNTNWLIKTAQAATRTTTDSMVAVAADQWDRFTIEINADATSVEYFINGTSVGTITTNIPNGGAATDGVGPDLMLVKSAGTNGRQIYADYFRMQCTLTTSR